MAYTISHGKYNHSASFQFCADHKLPAFAIIFRAQYVRLAADLAVLDVALPGTGGFVHGRLIPLSASRALETGQHSQIV